MDIKWIGALMLIAGFGYLGFSFGASFQKDIQCLRQLEGHIEYMICQLQFRQPPLPVLCHELAERASVPVRELFLHLCDAFQQQSSPDVFGCFQWALRKCPALPKHTAYCIEMLGGTLGQFDLEGQVRGLESVLFSCKKKIEQLDADRDQRIRSYQVFGICAGVAVAILLF